MISLGILFYLAIPETINYDSLSFDENIDYCVSIIHNIRKEEEFLKNCDLEKTNKYIMSVKKWKWKEN